MGGGRTLDAAGPARAAAARLPAGPGVYRFLDARGRVLYVGRAVNLRRRVSSYWADLGDRPHLARMLPRVSAVQALECDSEHEAAWLERNLMERVLPPWNKTPGGQESEVWIQLDRGPASPGLIVGHVPVRKQGVCCYGPYLGGSRVRLAVAGLLRAWPLHLCGATPSGTARELGRQRGVSAGDRERIADVVGAALAREPGAIAAAAAGLAQRRAAAVQAQAYEAAAQVQAELAALGWVTSAQRVTVPGTGDAVVCGWADGVLVRLEVRDGRMCSWRQTMAAAGQARRWLAATPPAWRQFAGRNAVLAARLRPMS